MPEESPQIDVAGATAAIEGAGGLNHLITQEVSSEYGEAQTPTPPGTTETTGATPPAEQAADTNFTGIDPLSLPDELQPIYKSMQADYTRKQQEIAAQRKQYESLGDPNEVQQAVQLHQALQDPAAWQALHSELSRGLEELGLSPAQANVAATHELQGAANAPSTQAGPGLDDLLATLKDDQELAPVASAFETLQSRLDTMEQSLAQRQAQEETAQLQMALVGELNRQESAIRQSNPTYTDDDINAIYELSSFHDGNLLAAQSRYEQIVDTRLQAYIQQKQGGAQVTGVQPVPGAAAITQQQVPAPKTLDEAHRAAMEHLRQIGAA